MKALIRWSRGMVGFLFLLLLTGSVGADVRVHGLFNGKALFSMDGERFLLRDGESGPEGLRLLRARRVNRPSWNTRGSVRN